MSCRVPTAVLQLGTASAPLYFQRSRRLVFSINFNSTSLFAAGTKYVTFKAVASLPAGVYVDARVVPVVNPATAGRFAFVLTNSAAGNVPFNTSVSNATAAYSFMYGGVWGCRVWVWTGCDVRCLGVMECSFMPQGQ